MLLGVIVGACGRSDVGTSSAAAGQGCALVNGTDFTGNDIALGKSTTVAGCCSECAAMPGCAAFTVWLGGPQCYLKHNASGRSASVNHTSGTVPDPLPPPPPSPTPFNPTALKNETDCRMRSLLVAYAAGINSNIDQRMAVEMIDALAGDPMMGQVGTFPFARKCPFHFGVKPLDEQLVGREGDGTLSGVTVGA